MLTQQTTNNETTHMIYKVKAKGRSGYILSTANLSVALRYMQACRMAGHEVQLFEQQIVNGRRIIQPYL